MLIPRGFWGINRVAIARGYAVAPDVLLMMNHLELRCQTVLNYKKIY